ncbi:Serine/threonine protein kinase [Goodfellowiella coeruleoviolacea]|uniref:Serine/threonine protein kinase n=1 Tax=Goodfellowiella coeruleoviolacea TaxID=334858 RepID=A0AAE3KJV8_9PSEU|nr:Serine/threonine protein kinase [Goodfellowiella coeruleoviolacea]
MVDGRYQLEDARGSGSGGVVWTAFDRKLKRTVALKRPHAVASQADRLQFRREAQTAAQVHHPNAISVFDAVDGDECWLVMEYSPADSLDRILATTGPLPPERVARIGMQIAAALDAIHAKNIVHRDVKPGNILVNEHDFAKLTDFGISIWREVTQTSDGQFSGTPAYAAPEVAAGRPATEASDVFSLGATLFAAVEGASPFGAAEPEQVLDRARRGELLPTHRAGPLAPLLAEMLAARPSRRPTAAQVRQRLGEIVGEWEAPTPVVHSRGRRTPLWRRPLYQAVAVVVLAAAVGGVVLISLDPPPEPGGAAAPGSALVVDERMANPCGLLDRKALERFGPAEVHTSYGNFNRCDVLVNVGAREPVDVEVQLVTRKSHPVRGEPFEVVEEPSNSDECDRTMPADDKYGVRVSAKLPAPPVDLCAIADVALDTVESTLRRGPVPRRAAPFPAESLANVDACQLLDDSALTVLPGVDSGSAVNAFGNWACKWYSLVSRTEINLRYDQHAAQEPIKGESTRLGDHDAFVRLDTDLSTSCTVSVLHEPANLPRRTTVELVVLTVKGDRPGTEYCAAATSLAEAAAAKLPR